jgi:hypothetical protein
MTSAKTWDVLLVITTKISIVLHNLLFTFMRFIFRSSGIAYCDEKCEVLPGGDISFKDDTIVWPIALTTSGFNEQSMFETFTANLRGGLLLVAEVSSCSFNLLVLSI